jgi:hypothetical protein
MDAAGPMPTFGRPFVHSSCGRDSAQVEGMVHGLHCDLNSTVIMLHGWQPWKHAGSPPGSVPPHILHHMHEGHACCKQQEAST